MTDLPQWALTEAEKVAVEVQATTAAMLGMSAMRLPQVAGIIARALADAAKPKWGEPDKTASYVLIAMDDGDVEPGYFDQLSNCWRRHDGSEIKRKVIATMPLPEAPEVKP